MILATIDVFNFKDFSCFAVKSGVRDLIFSAFRSILWLYLTLTSQLT